MNGSYDLDHSEANLIKSESELQNSPTPHVFNPHAPNVVANHASIDLRKKMHPINDIII